MKRLSALLILTALALNACAPAAAPVTNTEAAPQEAAPQEAVPTQATTEVAPTEAAAGVCEAGSRLFNHALLASDPLCIPEAPERIIALDMASVEATLLAGKSLQATSGWILSELPLIAPQFASALEGLEDVGYPANLELVARLKPDLILAVGGTSAGDSIDYEQAKLIAPVVFADPVIYNDWKLGMDLWTAVLNVSADYDAMRANYAQRVGELQAALGDDVAREISVISSSTYGYSLWMPDTPPGAILSDVGLARPESQRLVGEAATAVYGSAQYVTVSEERFDLIDADAIFYFSYASSDPDTAAAEDAHLAAFVEKPIWQALEAVKAGQAFQVPGYWWRSQTYILANRVLDDLFTHLTDTTATTPVLYFAAAPAAFPVTIEHKFGSTTLEGPAERVVSLGYTDQDAILALGVVPVGVRYFFGDQPDGVWPWAHDLLNGAAPEVLNMPFGELNYEVIAALDPDLIIGVSAGFTAEEYETLSAIAPTVAQSDAYVDFGVPWQEQTNVIGQALGQAERATDLVAEIEAGFAEVRATHPEFEGATAAIAAVAGEGQYFFSGPQHERQRFLTALGFVLPEELAALAGDAFYGSISAERLDLFDTDLLLWTISVEQQTAVVADPLYSSMAVHTEARDVFLDTSGNGGLAGPALVYSSVLSLPVAFDELVPLLAAAVDGDPATVVP